MKPQILFVGDHPHGITGNSNMLMEMLNRVDYSKYDVTVYAGNKGIINNPFKNLLQCPVIEGGHPQVDFVKENLITLLEGTKKLDVLIFVGLDLWLFHDNIPQILIHKRRLGFKWVSIFPYDTITVRKDWIKWLEPVDFPCVYSEYGYNMIKDHVKNVRYFRPPLHNADLFVSYPHEIRRQKQKEVFQILPDDAFVFGFFGVNQIRKDPQRLIKAFYQAKKDMPNLYLYLHTDANGVYNLDQYLDDCGREHGDVFIKMQGKYYDTDAMVSCYNIVDCVVTASLQEGLNWTIVEAMLCGTPVVASDTTAHKELLAGGVGILVKTDVPSYTPVITAKGVSWVDTYAADVNDLALKMKMIASDKRMRELCIEKGLKRGKQRVASCSDINDLLKEASKQTTRVVLKQPSVLFAQHSSAGDVLMTTRCLKDIRERHPNLQFIYMTSPQYMNIIEGNPYVDKVIPWNDEELSNHQVVYNPHGERILPGHWGRNSNSLLSDFYWKIMLIENPCDFYVGMKEPEQKIAEKISHETREIVILHTTGGDPEFRTYKYMKEIADDLWKKGYCTIQVGGKADYSAGALIDLRGKLSFQETARVVNKASYAITVDSFISHLCGALGVSQICLFGSGNSNVVKPNQIKGDLICMVPDYVKYCKGLGPCSASVRDCPVKCTGIHSPKDILEKFEEIIK